MAENNSNKKTSERKKDHVDLAISGKVGYQKTTGLEEFHFLHNALPEVNVDEIDPSGYLLGHKFRIPLFISSMTGGFTKGGSVNGIIAKVCEEYNLPFGVGSQRVALEEKSTRESFEIVRERAPTAFICANIGGCQLIDEVGKDQIDEMVDMIRADAIIVHLNPLQELMQPEGDRNFSGVLTGIKYIINHTSLPVIVKETGGGISGEVAKKLQNIGVSVIDCSGAGGTSWSKVENKRNVKKHPYPEFNDWGIPTAICIQQINELPNRSEFELIASGGIRNGFDIVKALCLGSDFTAAAQPVIKSVMEQGTEGMKNLLDQLERQIITIMCLLGATTTRELAKSHLYK